MSRQPPAARPEATGHSARAAARDLASPGLMATASTSAAATMSGRWLIAATARSWAVRIHLDDDRPGRPRRARSRVRCRSGRRGHPGPRPTGDRRTGPRRTPRSPRSPRPAIGWPPTNHRPVASARSTIAAFVLATSVTIASGRMILRQRPARRSINGRHEVAGPARTIRSASRRTDSAFASAASMTPSSAAALRGPLPDGDQAAIVQSFVSGLARTARAIEPPIRPNPRKAICISASIAAAAAGSAPSGRSVLPAARIVGRAGQRRLATAPLGGPSVGGAALGPVARDALGLLPRRPRPSAAGGPGSLGGVLAPDGRPALGAATILLEIRSAAWAAELVGRHRRQRRDRIDPAPTRPAR